MMSEAMIDLDAEADVVEGAEPLPTPALYRAVLLFVFLH